MQGIIDFEFLPVRGDERCFFSRRGIDQFRLISLPGDLILSTPSLDSSRVNNDPMHRYDGDTFARLPRDLDQRILSYDSLENRRYQLLRMKQPVPRCVTRIFQERCKSRSPQLVRGICSF